jgi:serine O-acetyltransferase
MKFFERVAKKRRDFRQFVELVREDYDSNFRDWTQPGFRAIFVHRFGRWANSVQNPRLVHVFLKFVYRQLYVHVRNHYTIELPLSTEVGRRLKIAHQGAIVIHHLSKIGDDCLIHQNVTMGSATDDTIMNAPILGNRVEIGCGAALIGAVVVGDNTRIGPNVVLTMSVPARCTVVTAAPRIFRFKQPAPAASSPTAAVTSSQP